MTTVNILRNEISDHAADQNVRRKMLVRLHTRNIDQRGQSVGEELRQRSGILMRDHTGHRPGCGSMFRGKGSAAALKKGATAIALIWPLAPQGIFHSFNHHEAVDRGFACQKTGLAPMLVVSGMTKQPH